MGICHAACLEGSPVVDLETGEPIEGGKADTWRYGDDPLAAFINAQPADQVDPLTKEVRSVILGFLVCPEIADCDQVDMDPETIVLERRARMLVVDEQHPDDAAVDQFARAMKDKLAKKRADGYGGWYDPSQCRVEFLSRKLREHVRKGDPVDVANFAMMLHHRGSSITAPDGWSEQDGDGAEAAEARRIIGDLVGHARFVEDNFQVAYAHLHEAERFLSAKPAIGDTCRIASVSDHNAAFDPADEVLGGAFKAGFKEGWIYAEMDADGDRYQEMADEYGMAVDTAPHECWDAHREKFFAMLPLAAIPEVGSIVIQPQTFDEKVEALAAFLCDQFDDEFDPCHGYSWPEHSKDDGYRGSGGYVKLQPSDVQARAREGATRILRHLGLAATEAGQ